jgi:phosphatidate cytidylyltransferase
MLKQRIITAIVLAIIFFVALLAESIVPWVLLIGVAIVLAFKEWIELAQVKDLATKVVGFVVLCALAYIIYKGFLSLQLVVGASVLMWLVLIFYSFTDTPRVIANPVVQLMVGAVVLATTAMLLIQIKLIPNGLLWIGLCFGTVWCADIGAYFVGRKIGKHKLAPSISPGKTIEGLLGGLFFVTLLSIPFLAWFSASLTLALSLWLVLMAVALVSVAGDLYESKLKRAAGLKDSSNVLPGHGGVLDRLDSLFPALPFLFAGLMILGLL